MKVYLVKAFTKNPTAGNPAGVVLDAEHMSDEQKQDIATKLGFSESAFVEKSDIADFKVRFFSPTQEVDFCGHATIATFHTLATVGRVNFNASGRGIVTQETGIGVLPVICNADGRIMMTQKEPVFSEVFEDMDDVAEMLGLSARDIAPYPCQIISTGARQLTVCVKNLETLKKIQPDIEKITSHSRQYNHAGIAAIITGGFTDKGDVATRNFAPIFGINEDPATGIAAGAIAHYANKYTFNVKKDHIIVEQGVTMNAASTIIVDITDATLVGGNAVIFGTTLV